MFHRVAVRRAGIAAIACALMGIAAGRPAPAARAATADNPAIRQAMSVAKPSVVFLYVQIQGSLLDHRDGQVHGPFISSSKGSGFFINPDGIIATATHVVSPTADDVKTALVDRYIIAITGNQLPSNSPTFATYMRATDPENVSFDVRVITQAMSNIPPKATNADLERVGLPASVVASSPVDALDVSILHVNGTHEPALLLHAGEATPNNQSMALMGYPQMAPIFSTAPDVTYGVLNEVRAVGSATPPGVADLPRQATVIVTNAYSEHGVSGGPGIDTQSLVLGLVSFGAVAGTPIFLVSSSDIASMVAKANVSNALGDADRRWRDGVAAQQRGDQATALADFRACATESHENTGCRAALAQLTSSSSGSSGPPLGLVIGGAVALVLVIGAAGMWLFRRPEPEYD